MLFYIIQYIIYSFLFILFIVINFLFYIPTSFLFLIFSQSLPPAAPLPLPHPLLLFCFSSEKCRPSMNINQPLFILFKIPILITNINSRITSP